MDYNKLWKILKEMGIQDHLTCLLRNLYAGQEATVRIEHGTTDWFRIYSVSRLCIVTCLFNLYAEYIMRNTRIQQYVTHELPDVQAGFRKGRGTRDQIANICWIIKKAREFQKNIYFCFIDYAKAFV